MRRPNDSDTHEVLDDTEKKLATCRDSHESGCEIRRSLIESLLNTLFHLKSRRNGRLKGETNG